MAAYPLDLFSTSQTNAIPYASDNVSEALSEVEQSHGLQAKKCVNGAPMIVYQTASGTWRIVQGCCNHWTCPRCGYMRAREEYGRMVHGAKKLAAAGETLYFLTITCLGGDMTPGEAETSYMTWTNRLLTACRTKQKRAGKSWAYVQVTEYQKRGVPHSHLITTFCPDDAVLVRSGKRRPDGIMARHDCLFSQWFQDRNVSAGLGPMCDVSEIKSAIGVAVYVSKYLFKDAVFTTWPPGWKRIRYSQSWPKMPDVRADNEAFPVVTRADWSRLMRLSRSEKVSAADDTAYEICLAHLATDVYKPKTGEAML